MIVGSSLGRLRVQESVVEPRLLFTNSHFIPQQRAILVPNELLVPRFCPFQSHRTLQVPVKSSLAVVRYESFGSGEVLLQNTHALLLQSPPADSHTRISSVVHATLIPGVGTPEWSSALLTAQQCCTSASSFVCLQVVGLKDRHRHRSRCMLTGTKKRFDAKNAPAHRTHTRWNRNGSVSRVLLRRIEHF